MRKLPTYVRLWHDALHSWLMSVLPADQHPHESLAYRYLLEKVMMYLDFPNYCWYDQEAAKLFRELWLPILTTLETARTTDAESELALRHTLSLMAETAWRRLYEIESETSEQEEDHDGDESSGTQD